jgi:DNA-binding response OmpR family regulator
MKPPHVLVVEDNRFVRSMIRSELQAAGMDVTEADSLETAQQAIPRSEADVLIVDYQLPDGTAVEGWAYAMRTNYMLARKMMVITEVMNRTDQESLQKSSGMTVLAKPFKRDELVAAVKKLLGSSGFRVGEKCRICSLRLWLKGFKTAPTPLCRRHRPKLASGECLGRDRCRRRRGSGALRCQILGFIARFQQNRPPGLPTRFPEDP